MTSERKPIDSHIVLGLTVRAYNDNQRYDLPPSYSHLKLPINSNQIPTKHKLRQWPHLVEIANNLPAHNHIPVGLLIGNNFMHAYRPQQIIDSNSDDEPFAIKTAIGWKIMGHAKKTTLATLVDQPTARQFVNFNCSPQPNKELSKLIDVFNTDFHDAHDKSPGLSIEDVQFLDIMKQQTTISNKRVTMPLPFKSKPHPINTKHAALHRFKLLEKRFAKDKTFKEQYHTFMNDIISKGEAVHVQTESDTSWYIPHFGVFHPKKPDKIRVVFDCAAKVGGVSLNDFLLQGPDHMNDLQGILLRFRIHPIAIMGDIERMFHQFKVSAHHQDYLRFIWYDSEGLPTTYKMTVHLFGARSSPACATYGLRYLADQYKLHSPDHFLPHHFIHHDFYVDDGLASVSSETEAINLVKQTQSLCATGQLRLHKIISNSRAVMAALPRSECASALADLDLTSEPLPPERSLGVLWDTNTDHFTFKHEVPSKPDTRRGVLSSVASVFDPLGLISPFTLKGRMILQDTCKGNSEWDAPLDSTLLKRWSDWKSDLTNVNHIRVPRCLTPSTFDKLKSAQIHTFADASTTGHGHCSYLRLVDTNNRVHVALLASKAKVAPIKQVTIPRLELQAACSAARATKKYTEELVIPNLTNHFYSDSTVVLGYLHNTTERYHTYVANRIATIRSLTDLNCWSHVPTDLNPADLASRGAAISTLINSCWFSGPKFLWNEPLVLPTQPQLTVNPEDPEVKQPLTTLKTTLSNHTITFDQRLSQFSTWNKTVSCTAALQRLINKTVHKDTDKAQQSILKLVQHEHFSAEIDRLESNQEINKSSSLIKLSPFLDDKGILRIGGRLHESTVLSFEEKHPIIIPKSSHLATLIIDHCHKLAAHQGREHTLAQIRSIGFWIVNARAHVLKYLNKCVTCKRNHGKPHAPQMATLPAERLAEVPPFTHCGLDCFGPFITKDGRKERKCHGLIITCMSSRAVHLELLEDMTSDCFINALRNFISIRGAVSSIRCDQGTNFVGAFNDLAKNMEGPLNHKLHIKFTFNPPHSSNMGGVWERLIRSARSILKGMGEKYGGRLSTSNLRTLFYEVMAVMNSRPLGAVTHDHIPLTPNMLLTMKSKITLPLPGHFEDADIYSRKRWRTIQQLANEFWRRWRSEYIQTLQARQKWTAQREPLAIGDIVHVLKEESLRNDWSLARVVGVDQSHDGEVRSVKLLIGSKGYPSDKPRCLVRPVNKVVVLVKASTR
ncbi:uncharacterized protein [Watersipora subatra]|uniref:uncharacterized protein n=1 Tax=Watersipora subatra TaxID=2589382 RepID=UPI00355AD02F